MNSPLKEALRQRRGKSVDLTIMIGPGAPPKEEELEAKALEGEEAPEQELEEEGLMEEAMEDEGDEEEVSRDLSSRMSEREKQKLMEEEPKTLMDKVKRLAMMRGKKL